MIIGIPWRFGGLWGALTLEPLGICGTSYDGIDAFSVSWSRWRDIHFIAEGIRQEVEHRKEPKHK